MAQNRSGCVVGIHLRISPSAVTISAASSESIVSPSLADEIADPATQGDAADAYRPGVAEADGEAVLGPRGETSSAVRPVSAQRRPRVGVDLERLQSRRSMTMPPSVVLWPAPLWPPLRTASSVPVSRAKR